MKEEDRELLLKDLCARLPYGVKAQVFGWDEEKGEVEIPLKIYSINADEYIYFVFNDYDINYLPLENVRPYLRPMSSMTIEERQECQEILDAGVEIQDEFIHIIDSSIKRFSYLEMDALFKWLNKKMFDHRGLIVKGLAISTEKFNPYKD